MEEGSKRGRFDRLRGPAYRYSLETPGVRVPGPLAIYQEDFRWNHFSIVWYAAVRFFEGPQAAKAKSRQLLTDGLKNSAELRSAGQPMVAVPT